MQTQTGDPPEFTDEQLHEALRRVGDEARQAAFAAGLSVMVVKGGRLVLLKADGQEEVIGPVPSDFTAKASKLP